MANYNYIKENHKQFNLMLRLVVDESSANNWRDTEHITNFKNGVLSDYIMFLYNLNFLNIQANNSLYNQYQFGLKLFSICDNFKKDGVQSFKGGADTILQMLVVNIYDWFQNDRDIELKKQEKEFYTNLAFVPKDSEMLKSDRISQLKLEASKNNKIKF